MYAGNNPESPYGAVTLMMNSQPKDTLYQDWETPATCRTVPNSNNKALFAQLLSAIGNLCYALCVQKVD
jgi:hypothetical protein